MTSERERLLSELMTWKDKILDYEIETGKTNLNQTQHLPWKDKILDYEIETYLSVSQGAKIGYLEKIRFSITRLKRNMQPETTAPTPTWKDKILDYEIETVYSAYL